MQDMGYSGAGMGQYPPSYERSYHGQHPSMGMPPSSMGGGYRMPIAHHDGAMAQWSGSAQHPPMATQQVCAHSLYCNVCECVEQRLLLKLSGSGPSVISTGYVLLYCGCENVHVGGQPC